MEGGKWMRCQFWEDYPWKGIVMDVRKDGSSMTRFMEVAVTPMYSMGTWRSVTSNLLEYWNIVKLWFLSSHCAKWVWQHNWCLRYYKVHSKVSEKWNKIQQELQKRGQSCRKWVKVHKRTKTPNIPASHRGERGELLVVFCGIFWSAAKWRTGGSINHLHSFWSRPGAGSPGGALTAHGVHPRVGAV